MSDSPPNLQEWVARYGGYPHIPRGEWDPADGAEEAEVSPVISVAVEPGSIVVHDNGPGIKTATVKSILDYTIRVSSREAYVSPTRGAQGNALKTILAMGFVLDRKYGEGAEA